MKVKVHIEEKGYLKLDMEGDLLVIIALNKIVSELKDMESLSVILRESEKLKHK